MALAEELRVMADRDFSSEAYNKVMGLYEPGLLSPPGYSIPYTSWTFDQELINGLSYYLEPGNSTYYAIMSGIAAQDGSSGLDESLLPPDFARSGVYAEMMDRFHNGYEIDPRVRDIMIQRGEDPDDDRPTLEYLWRSHLNTLSTMLQVLPTLGTGSGSGLNSDPGARYPDISVLRDPGAREYVITYAAGEFYQGFSKENKSGYLPFSEYQIHISDARKADEASVVLDDVVDNRVIEMTSPGVGGSESISVSIASEILDVSSLPFDIISALSDTAVDVLEHGRLREFMASLDAVQAALMVQLHNLGYNGAIVYGTEFPDKPQVFLYDGNGE